jgi:hypothetical protein
MSDSEDDFKDISYTEKEELKAPARLREDVLKEIVYFITIHKNLRIANLFFIRFIESLSVGQAEEVLLTLRDVLAKHTTNLKNGLKVQEPMECELKTLTDKVETLSVKEKGDSTLDKLILTLKREKFLGELDKFQSFKLSFKSLWANAKLNGSEKTVFLKTCLQGTPLRWL